MNVASDCILLSIHPANAKKVYLGHKRAELRKSFPPSARFVFLYETAPVSAVTGAFLVKEAIKTSVQDAVSLASANGVEASRAANYYGDRENGWVIRIGNVVNFRASIPLSTLKERDHYFSIPQTFAYLARFEGLTQELVGTLIRESSSQVKLRPLTLENRGRFESLVKDEVGGSYEDIDEDFLLQVLNGNLGLESAFSTRGKKVFEALWGDDVVGFTVLTEKTYGAWKTGPTILLPEFRGFGLGQALRERIECYCAKRRAIGIYCTCPDSRPAVVSYLINSGMVPQARLRKHLSNGRDELVFAKKLRSLPAARPIRMRESRGKANGTVIRLTADDRRRTRIVRFFLREMARWYFEPHEDLEAAICRSLSSLESGITRYSAKGRMLYAFVDDRNRPKAAVLITSKRSRMAKLNIVVEGDRENIARRLLTKVLADTVQFRRIYLTVPVTRIATMAALSNAGFSFEGVLTDPFGLGVDHACYGFNRPEQTDEPNS